MRVSLSNSSSSTDTSLSGTPADLESVCNTPASNTNSLRGSHQTPPATNSGFSQSKHNDEYKSLSTAKKGKPRLKRFTSKVKTGCNACKRRRVKCSEGAICKQCLKSGTPCTYENVPKAKIYEGVPVKIPAAAQIQFTVFDLDQGRQQENSINHAQIWQASSCLQLANSLQAFRLSVLPFERVEERAAFSYFLHFTAPALESYVNAGLWSQIIPQYACFSEAVREILLAAVIADENWQGHDYLYTDKQSTALRRYLKGLRSITSNNTTKVEALVASLMAWSFEAMLFNYTSASIHMKGAKALMTEIKRENDILLDNGLEKLAEVTRIYYFFNALYTQPEPPILDNPWLNESEMLLVDTIRDQLNGILFRCHKGIRHVEVFAHFLRAANNAYRALQFSRKASLLEREATRLLYDLACALLSEEQLETFGLTSQIDKNNADVLLLQAMMILRELDQLSKTEQSNVAMTISFVLCHFFTFFPDSQNWIIHLDLMVEMAQAHPDAFGRIRALEGSSISALLNHLHERQKGKSVALPAKFGRPLLTVPG